MNDYVKSDFVMIIKIQDANYAIGLISKWGDRKYITSNYCWLAWAKVHLRTVSVYLFHLLLVNLNRPSFVYKIRKVTLLMSYLF